MHTFLSLLHITGHGHSHGELTLVVVAAVALAALVSMLLPSKEKR
jgi:hypothetical protein